MTGNAELLNYIYQNSEMGKQSLETLIKSCTSEEFKSVLQNQISEYNKIYDEAKQRLQETNNEVKDIGSLLKISSYISINMNTMMDKTPSHMAEMIMQGCTMGIIDITRKIKDYKEKDKTILDLANKLLAFEEQSFQAFKKWI